jgi:cytochrome b6-f complex iron-sulfur subunit
MNDKKLSRKEFLNIAWLASGALALSEATFAGLRFLSPRVADGEFGGVFTLGAPEEYPLGSVTPIEGGNFYLVRLEDGGLLAIYQKCTHLGCVVPYEPTKGAFVCPCHGSEFTLEGDLINPPAPRPLDLFLLTLEEGQIFVDTSQRIERDQAGPEHIVYP